MKKPGTSFGMTRDFLFRRTAERSLFERTLFGLSVLE
jgi:hypothetical protein